VTVSYVQLNELDWAMVLNSFIEFLSDISNTVGGKKIKNSLIVNYAIGLQVCPIISSFICQI
jgi:hypothetical protein